MASTLDSSALSADDRFVHGPDIHVQFRYITDEMWAIDVIGLFITDGKYRVSGSSCCPNYGFARHSAAWDRATRFVDDNGLVPS